MRPDEYKKKATRKYLNAHPEVKANLAQQKQAKAAPRKAHPDELPLPKLKDFIAAEDLQEIEEDAARGPVQWRYARRKIESNAHRFETSLSDDEKDAANDPELASSQHLHQLLKHTDLNSFLDSNKEFQFRDEKAWNDFDTENTDLDPLALDLDEVDYKLSLVPIYERLKVPYELLKEMGYDSSLEENRVETTVRNSQTPSSEKSEDSEEDLLESNISSAGPEQASPNDAEEENMEPNSEESEKSLPKPQTKSLEAWLDDFLDD